MATGSTRSRASLRGDHRGADRWCALMRYDLVLRYHIAQHRLSVCGRTAIVRYGTVMYNESVTTMTASQARAALPELLGGVVAGDEVTITRHGLPVAVVVRPDALRSRRADAALATATKLRGLLAASRRTTLPSARLSETRAEELIAEISVGRDLH